MQLQPNKLILAMASAALLALAGCGGGGGSNSAPSSTLSVTAATGAPFVGAVITVTDKTGATVGTSSAIGTDGLSTITLSAGALPPFVLTATRTSADGAVESLVSVVPSTSGGAAAVNITPVTTLIASRLSASGDPTKLASEVAAGTATVTTTTVNATVSDVQAILAPILMATGTSAADPLSGSFTTDGTGYDRLLDTIKVTIIPASTTTANIEIGIKQQLAEGTAPTTIQFTNLTPVATVTASPPTISANTLLPNGTSALIAQHLTQLNTCFALATASRVNNANPSGGAIAAATSTNIIAPECRSAFIQNGGGAITFKSNGAVIGATSNAPFHGLFFDGGTGVVFSQGSYEFTRSNGDIVVSYKSKNAAGNETYDTFALRLDTDGKLKQIGNQYAYPGGVSAYHQLRHFITLSQSAYDYYSTGYTLNVTHVTGGAGVDGSIFDRVEVTSPRGNVLTLKPRSGYSGLQLFNNPTILGSNFVRLNSVYADTNNTNDPAVKDSASLFFANRSSFPDAVLSAIPAQSVWKFDYFLAGNTGATPDATQYYKTRARALTIAELKTQGLATLADADITTLQAHANAAGGGSPGMVPISGDTTETLHWNVATGSLPPTSIQIWGNYVYSATTYRFNDASTVGSTARTGSVQCSPTGASDHHCVGAAGTAYVTPTLLNGAHLWARDPGGREYTSFYAMYQLNP